MSAIFSPLPVCLFSGSHSRRLRSPFDSLQFIPKLFKRYLSVFHAVQQCHAYLKAIRNLAGSFCRFNRSLLSPYGREPITLTHLFTMGGFGSPVGPNRVQPYY
jgi:hypothetical protein